MQTDLTVKKWIDEGRYTGPDMHITAGYLETSKVLGSFTPQMLELRGPEDAKAFVEYWAGLGATSFKAYMHITRAELGAAIVAAHARGLKVTGPPLFCGFPRSGPVWESIIWSTVWWWMENSRPARSRTNARP